jgi:hypothetical protein
MRRHACTTKNDNVRTVVIAKAFAGCAQAIEDGARHHLAWGRVDRLTARVAGVKPVQLHLTLLPFR